MTNEKVGEAFLNLVRLYTFNTPIPRGRHRAYLAALKLCKTFPKLMPAVSTDGRKFLVDLSTGMQTTVFFLGEYEKAITDIVVELLREGDVCLDVGANFGWYTTLFHKYGGPTGEVHAFEPVPPTYELLAGNVGLMTKPSNVVINNLALGDKKDELVINLFEGLSSGHASLSAQGRDDAIEFRCQVVTLDSYLAEKRVADVNFVKVDIEGAEMMFLKGAEQLFKQRVPPIWLMEMARAQTSNFGYLPNAILKFMSARANYDFYRIDEPNRKLIQFERFTDDDIGANVICIPRGAYADRLESIREFLAAE